MKSHTNCSQDRSENCIYSYYYIVNIINTTINHTDKKYASNKSFFSIAFSRINKSASIHVVLLNSHRIISLFFSLLALAFIFAFIVYLSVEDNSNNIIIAQEIEQQMEYTRTGAPLTIVPGLVSNILTGVSFLVGTSSFILGLRIQSISKTIKPNSDDAQTGLPISSQSSSPLATITKYYEILILALVFPAIVINIYGILAVASHLYLEDAPYLVLLFVLFIPIGAILFLVKKLH